MTQNDQDRRALIQAAIRYCAGRNDNMPSQCRRVLSQKFGVEVLELEVAGECQILAGEAVLELAALARRASR